MSSTVSRSNVPEAIRRAVLAENKFCTYCGWAASEVDHYLARARGGDDDRRNLVAACALCNREKSDMTIPEWQEWRETRGAAWPPPNFTLDILPEIWRRMSKPTRFWLHLDVHHQADEDRDRVLDALSRIRERHYRGLGDYDRDAAELEHLAYASDSSREITFVDDMPDIPYAAP